MAQVADQVEVQRRALLQAVADAGQAGRAAYERAQGDVQSQQAGAVNGALDRAAFIGSTPGMTAEAQQTASAPYQRAATDLSVGQASFGQDLARQQASGEQYLGNVKAAIPMQEAASRVAVQRILAESSQATGDRQQALTDALMGRQEHAADREYNERLRRDEAARTVTDRAREDEQYRRAIEQQNVQLWWDTIVRNEAHDHAQEQHQWDVEDRQYAQAHRGSSGGGSGGGSGYYNVGGSNGSGVSGSIDQLIKDFGGVTEAKTALSTFVRQYAQNSFEGSRRAQQPQSEQAALSVAFQRAAEEVGIDPGQLQTFLGSSGQFSPHVSPLASVKPQERSGESIRASRTYRDYMPKVQAEYRNLTTDVRDDSNRIVTHGIDNGIAKSQIAAEIRAFPDYRQNKAIYEQIISDL